MHILCVMDCCLSSLGTGAALALLKSTSATLTNVAIAIDACIFMDNVSGGMFSTAGLRLLSFLSSECKGSVVCPVQ